MSNPGEHFSRAVGENVCYWIEHVGWPPGTSPDVVREMPNMLKAVHYGLALPATRRDAALLLTRMHRAVERSGWWEQWLALCEFALQIDQGAIGWETRARLLNGRGILRRNYEQLDLALADHEQAGELARDHGDALLWATTQHDCAQALARKHAPAEAAGYAEAALACFAREAPGSFWHAATLNSLGDIARSLEQFDRAVALLTEAVKIFGRLGDKTDLARTLNNLANTHHQQAQWPEAIACYDAALLALEDSGDESTKSLLRANYGIVYYMQEDYRRAEMLFREADTPVLRQTGNTMIRGIIAQNLGSALLKQGSLVEAEWHLNRAALLWKQSNNNLSLGNTTGTLAELYALKGDAPVALAHYVRAQQLLAEYPDHPWARQLTDEFETARQRLLGEQ